MAAGHIPFIDGDSLRRLMDHADAVDVLRTALASDRPDGPLRSHFETNSGTFLVMPYAFGSEVGVKLVGVAPQNCGRNIPTVHALYVLFDADSMAPCALLDGASLTGLRTSAVSALATSCLAPPSATRLVIFGAGTQAHEHLDAMAAVRPISELAVISRSRGPAERLVARAEGLGIRARLGRPEDVSWGEIICTATTSTEPLFDGRDLQPGAHVNAVGSFRPDMRELDASTLSRCELFVDTRAGCLAEAGEIVGGVADGTLDPSAIRGELRDLASGSVTRHDRESVTVFKSVGDALQDVAIASAAYARTAASRTDAAARPRG